MFVDASVIISILMDEADAQALSEHLDDADSGLLVTSVIAVWEATAVIFKQNRLSMTEARSRVQDFLDATQINVLPVSNDNLSGALQAFEQYGRHRYPATDRNSSLNLADCFHYATAKAQHVPILTKDGGFALTDLETIGLTKNQ
ncbi:type II toxin-antitoxin system VapC family toxin [Phyllobacterium sp. K27]